MPHPLHLLYDGDCGFCTRAVRTLLHFDVRGVLRTVPSQERDLVLREFPSVALADLDQAMYVVDSTGRTYRGFFAFRRVMWESPWLWLALPIFYFPGAGWIGPKVYAWVARNRRRLGCGGPSCPLPPRSAA